MKSYAMFLTQDAEETNLGLMFQHGAWGWTDRALSKSQNLGKKTGKQRIKAPQKGDQLLIATGKPEQSIRRTTKPIGPETEDKDRFVLSRLIRCTVSKPYKGWPSRKTIWEPDQHGNAYKHRIHFNLNEQLLDVDGEELGDSLVEALVNSCNRSSTPFECTLTEEQALFSVTSGTDRKLNSAIEKLRGVAAGSGDRDPEQVERVQRTIEQLKRNPKLVAKVKVPYKSTCQMCQEPIETPSGSRLVDAAHIQALGAPHSGPDALENMLCLCPNCHRQFDSGAIVINDDFTLEHFRDGDLGTLVVKHWINETHLKKHRKFHKSSWPK